MSPVTTGAGGSASNSQLHVRPGGLGHIAGQVVRPDTEGCRKSIHLGKTPSAVATRPSHASLQRCCNRYNKAEPHNR
jgi:hypothetical protein